MRTLSNRPGLRFGLISLIAIAACFDVSDALTTHSTNIPIQSTNGMTTWNSVVTVDLTQYSVYTNNKSKIDTVAFNSLTLTIPNGGIMGDNNAAEIISGSVALRPAGATDASGDIPVNTLPNTPIMIATGATVTFAASSATATQVNTFLTNAAKGPGKFSVVLSGAVQPAMSGTTVVDFTLNVDLTNTLSVSLL